MTSRTTLKKSTKIMILARARSADLGAIRMRTASACDIRIGLHYLFLSRNAVTCKVLTFGDVYDLWTHRLTCYWLLGSLSHSFQRFCYFDHITGNGNRVFTMCFNLPKKSVQNVKLESHCQVVELRKSKKSWLLRYHLMDIVCSPYVLIC